MKSCLLTMGRKIIIINTTALTAALRGKMKVYCPLWAESKQGCLFYILYNQLFLQPSSASSLAPPCCIWQSYPGLQERSLERGTCPEGQQLPCCSSQGQGQRVHLCQIQLRLYHGLLIPEGHQVGAQKNGLAPMAGKSDTVLRDAPGTEVFCMFTKHQWCLLYIQVHFCH